KELPHVNVNEGPQILKMSGGVADVDLFCKADIENFKFTKPILNGNIKIKNADITYVPRKMRLVNSALTLSFTETDLHLKNSRFQLGKSIINMNCSIKNFLNLYYSAPEKILVKLNLSSPQLYLNEFMPILGPRSKVTRSKTNGNTVKEFTEQLGTVMEASKMNIQLTVKKAIYKNFIAKDLYANIDLIGDGVILQKVSVSHAGGKLSLTGNIRQMGAQNKFYLKSRISNVNVKEFFYAFDNFGQKSITDKNLRGYLSSTVDVNGSLNNAGSVLSRSIKGIVAFNLRNAALLNFEPLEKAGKFAFANRNFSDIRMQNLDGTFNINGDKIGISPMQINSSVMNMDIKGIYSLGAGTEIELDIPLRNPEKDAGLTENEKKQSRMKGIVLHLKAVDGENGKVKIRWNGGRKAK
ncbi:MAG: AsmA family protein, partial [Flavobacterium sp.]